MSARSSLSVLVAAGLPCFAGCWAGCGAGEPAGPGGEIWFEEVALASGIRAPSSVGRRKIGPA